MGNHDAWHLLRLELFIVPLGASGCIDCIPVIHPHDLLFFPPYQAAPAGQN